MVGREAAFLSWRSPKLPAVRRLIGIALGVLGACVLLMIVTWLTQDVLPGSVNGGSLRLAVAEQSRSAASGSPCHRERPSGAWSCDVWDTEGSGVVTYRVVVRSGSSCWHGRLVANGGEGPMPRTIHGCVHLWQPGGLLF